MLAAVVIVTGIVVGGAESVSADPRPMQREDTAGPPVSVIEQMPSVAASSRADGVVTVEVLGRGAGRAVRRADPSAEVLGALPGVALVRMRVGAVAQVEAAGLVVRDPVRVEASAAGVEITADDLLALDAGSDLDGRATRLPPTTAHDGRVAGGRKVKVGIISLFDPALYRKQLASGKVPRVPSSQQRCFTRGGRCPFGTRGVRGGNAAAQIVYSENKAIDLYLVETGGLIDIRNAIDWLAANDVTVLLMDMTLPWDGPGDGTGPAAALVDRAVRKGMMWINPAGDQKFDNENLGDFRGSYWRGSWRDDDGDGWMNFPNGRESLGVRCGLLYGLRWSDWDSPITDYDLYIGDASGTPDGSLFEEGESAWNVGVRDQSRPGAQPLEGNTFLNLCNRDPSRGPVIDENRDGYVAVYIERTDRTSASTRGDVLELMVLGGLVDAFSPVSSHQTTFADSSNPGMVSVGGITSSWPYVPSGISSSGPTNDGRVKPDVVAPDCARVFEFRRCGYLEHGGWFSTGVSAQRIAARVAAHQAAFDITDPRLLQFLVQRRSFRFEGEPLPSNELGWGELRLPRLSPVWEFTALPSYTSTVYRSPRTNGAAREQWFETTLWQGLDEPDVQKPGMVEVQISSMRRAGELEVLGQSDLPGGGFLVRLDTSSRPQTVVVPVADIRSMHFRWTTGGHIVARLYQWAVARPGRTGGYLPLTAPLTVRSLADPALPASTKVQVELPAVATAGARLSSLSARVTVVASRPTVVVVGGRRIEVPTGRTTRMAPVAARDRVIEVRSSTAARVQIDLVARAVTAPVAASRHTMIEAQKVLDRSFGAGDAATVSFASRRVPANARQVLVHVLARSRAEGVVTMQESDGVHRPVLGMAPGVSSAIVLVSPTGLRALVRSSVAARLEITVLGYSSTGPADFRPLVAPAVILRDPGRPSISADGQRVAVVATGGRSGASSADTTQRLYLWDRTSGGVEPVVESTSGARPNATVTLVALSADGRSVSFTSSATDLVSPPSAGVRALFVQNLDTDVVERFDLTGVIAGGDRLVDASSDLTTFVSAAGAVVRIAPDRSHVAVVRQYPTSVGLDISSDGSRILLADAQGTRVAQVDAVGGPGPAVPRSTGAALSGDGTRFVAGGSLYTAAGSLIRVQCEGVRSSTASALDADGSTSVYSSRCGRSTGLIGSSSVVSSVGPVEALLPLGVTDPTSVVSADGSTVAHVAGDRFLGVHTLS